MLILYLTFLNIIGSYLEDKNMFILIRWSEKKKLDISNEVLGSSHVKSNKK